MDQGHLASSRKSASLFFVRFLLIRVKSAVILFSRKILHTLDLRAFILGVSNSYKAMNLELVCYSRNS